MPMLRAGDEFGNSQKGNNNAWCQDNKISYIDWEDLEKNKELFEFTVELIGLRKDHPVFHGRYAKKMYDYISCGCPDVSFHGEQAWNQTFVNYNRHFAVMYTGAYEKSFRKKMMMIFMWPIICTGPDTGFIRRKPPKGKKWEICLSSGSGREAGIYDKARTSLRFMQGA